MTVLTSTMEGLAVGFAEASKVPSEYAEFTRARFRELSKVKGVMPLSAYSIWARAAVLAALKSPLKKENWDLKKIISSFQYRKKEWGKVLDETRFLSPSKVMREQEKIEYANDDLPVSVTSAIDVGILCHKVMEDWDFTKKQPAKILPSSVKNALNKLSLMNSGVAENLIVEESQEILKEFFKSSEYDRLSQVKIVGREMPFVYSQTGKNGQSTYMRGVIDLVYEENGQIVIADYKTNRVDDKKMKELQTYYKPQSLIYTHAVSKVLGKNVGFELVFLRAGKSIRFFE
jgi:ATP-dependent exoDNAse (exonuclease V) beta subunit